MLLNKEEKILKIPFKPLTLTVNGIIKFISAVTVSSQLKKLRFIIP